MLGTIKSEYLGCGFYNYLCDWSIKRDAPDIRTDNPAFSDSRRAERYIFFWYPESVKIYLFLISGERKDISFSDIWRAERYIFFWYPESVKIYLYALRISEKDISFRSPDIRKRYIFTLSGYQKKIYLYALRISEKNISFRSPAIRKSRIIRPDIRCISLYRSVT